MPASLNSVTLCNFKSIRGELTITPFLPFTAIIGPNGSGKSNIMDGIRFALGEKPNVLRVKCLSQLVHGAIIGKPRKEGTHVKIVFKGDDNKNKSFTRIINGEDSQYDIDDEIVTYSFYMAELKEFGLDINVGNFLVSQGNSEYFATKLPKELTVTFETISGSIAYKKVYTRLMKNIQRLKEKIYYTNQMKKQLLMQKICAVAEANEAKKYLELQKQYTEIKTKFYLVRLLLIKKTVEPLQNEKREKKLQIEQCLCDKKNAMLSLEQHKSQFMSLSNSLEDVDENIRELENIIYDCKAKHVVLMKTISCWQEKHDHTYACLNSANKMRDANIRIIQELKDELEQIDNKLEEIREASQVSIMELAEIQVKRYWDLKCKVECRAKNFVEQINKLMRDQELDRAKFENEYRIKQELEDKIKRTSFMKDNLEKCLQKLEDLNVKFKANLEEKIKDKQKLIKKITETKETSLKLENNIAKVLEELDGADIVSEQMKKGEIIKNLEQFSGVYGRLSQLCKPIHSRYYVPVVKVFGKNMDAIVVDNTHTAIQCIQYLKQQKLNVETFLPLDSVKPISLSERLRNIKEPKDVKLLFDVLNITSVQIMKAVLFVTKDTLICETAEDARRMAYEIDKHNTYSCVSLDGCFFRKDGLISGGQVDLSSKAKQWQKLRECCEGAWDISVLEKRKEELTKNLNELPNILHMQSDLDILEKEINGLFLQVKYIQQNIKDSKSKIEEIYEILQKVTQQLSLSNLTISKIQHNMQETNKNIKSVQKHIDIIGNEMFASFCENLNIPDISYYEKNNLRIYKEKEEKRMNLEKQYDYIKNQLCFERKRDNESQILKWKHALEQADVKLNEVHQQETIMNSKIEQEEIKLLKLKMDRTDKENNLKNITKKLAEYKSEIRDMEKLYLENQKAYIAIQKQIDQKKIEYNTVLKECKMESITIPIAEILHGGPGESSSTYSSSTSNPESSNEWDITTKINFSQFPKDILNNTKEDLQNSIVQLDETFTEIQNQIKTIVNPNFKVSENIDPIIKEISKLNKKLKILRQEDHQTKKQLNQIKEKRYNLFSNCLEYITTAIDSTYKSLTNELSAQAFLVPDNTEELYIGGLHYSCIPPFKFFQPISNLSGGEKSLASLALQFAIQRYKPAPFFIMDEGDAALDTINIENFIRFIRSLLKPDDMKVIMITQKSLISRFDVLIGVTVEPDAECTESKIFSISLEKYSSRV